MLSIFPEPYPDEILYSVIARYHVWEGNISPKMTLREIFNSQTVSATVDLPSNLNALVNNLPKYCRYSAEELIINNTLFPYYSAFLGKERADTLLLDMKGLNGGAIHARTGVMASCISSPTHLIFCPDCLEDDLASYGEAYWHRIHQVPGVLVCSTHNQILRKSIVKAKGFNKHEFFAATKGNCPVKPLGVAYDSDVFCKLTSLAKDIEWLFSHDKFINEPEWYYERYNSGLINKNLATSKGRVYQKDLMIEFISFYGSDFLKTVQSMVYYDNQSNWLSSIVRKHRKSFHPLRHLLMMRFLSGSAENFAHDSGEYRPFGSGPWPCLNAAADHYLKAVISDLLISHCCDTKRPVGTFSCSCGFVYSRRGPDREKSDQFKIGRIKDFGPIWKARLKQLIEVEKLGLRETARRLNVDPGTVKKYAAQMGINTFWNSNTFLKNKKETINNLKSNLEDFKDKRDSNRNIWLSAQNKYPCVSKTRIREMVPATYAWLYRNDREWLDTNSPVSFKKNVENKRVNWHLRDNLMLDNVKKVVKEIWASPGKPQRISLTRIGVEAGILALLEKHLNKLPQTKAYLEMVVESVEDYRVRRVKWASRQLQLQGQEVDGWRIVRKAGLRSGYSQRIAMVIDDEVLRYSILEEKVIRVDKNA